ncbi:hypothetical protein HW555_013070 [Spodoptera exigua]|uniref:Cell cycle control protein 50A n=1 Tax=Spodoptera exigua TaxID=7107 RepID=A0A835G407_SPOEX|nr:hypothetical protein HW555_013070 [Spodoptera exigua]
MGADELNALRNDRVPGIHDSEASNKSIMQKVTQKLLIIGAIVGITFIIFGIILISCASQSDGYEIIQDYTDCMDFKNPEMKCKDSLKAMSQVCSCFLSINVKELMKAPVTLYYELESYDDITSKYAKSRDDKQLAGQLITNTSSCGNYTYANTTNGMKLIAPCGALADAMFNDTFSMQINNTYLIGIRTGLLSEEDKKPYRNPPGDLNVALQDYAKPINWKNNVTMLDEDHPENNGFQNEAFIAWMQTNLRRKPVMRINHTGYYEQGLPAANYVIRVRYAYPEERYSGRRKIIISSFREWTNYIARNFGIAFLVLGSVTVVAVAALFYLKRREGR